jgi:hypothetical protein
MFYELSKVLFELLAIRWEERDAATHETLYNLPPLCDRATHRVGIIATPFATRERRQLQRLDHLLKLIDHLIELLTVCTRERRRRSKLASRLEAKTVHAELESRVKITTVHTWATASCTFTRIYLTLEFCPCALLSRVERHTSCSPAIPAPFGSRIVCLDNLLERCELRTKRCTDGGRLVIGELVLTDMEDF